MLYVHLTIISELKYTASSTGWERFATGGIHCVWIAAVSLNWVKELYNCWVRWSGSLRDSEQENGGTQKKKVKRKLSPRYISKVTGVTLEKCSWKAEKLWL